MSNTKELLNLQNQIQQLNVKVNNIEESKDWDYQKVLSAIKYLYRYYDDMTKDKVDIRS